MRGSLEIFVTVGGKVERFYLLGDGLVEFFACEVLSVWAELMTGFGIGTVFEL